jgi:hypothetical protein
MKLSVLCAAAALFALPAAAQIQSGTGIGARGPSTGTSGDTAGAVGTTAPRSGASETSTGGASSPPLATRPGGACDALTGDERIKCQRDQAASGGMQGGAGASSGSTGAGSTGMSPAK